MPVHHKLVGLGTRSHLPASSNKSRKHLEATKEVQENRVEYFKKKGDQQFKVDGRNAEITVYLVLQARATMSDKKVDGPEDAVASEMIKQLVALGEDLDHNEVLPRALHGPDGGAKFVEDCETGLLEENPMQSRRKGSGATRPLRSHRYFRSDTRLALFSAWSKRGKQKTGRNCTW